VSGRERAVGAVDRVGQRSSVIALTCAACGTTYPADFREGPCECGTVGQLVVDYDLDRVGWEFRKREQIEDRAGLLHYRPFLPLRDVDPVLVSLISPIRSVPWLAARVGVRELLLKDETVQPTASLKDRASAVAVARADALGHADIACASSGNAAIATAAMAAAQGLKAHVYLPRTAPDAKRLLAMAYGAEVRCDFADYEAAYAACEAEAAQAGWYNRNSGHNPYAIEGKKTCGLEIAEQTAADPVGWLVVPVGDGCTIAGIWKGICEMNQVRGLSRAPRLLGVQTTAASPVCSAWEDAWPTAEGRSREGTPAATIADAIAVQTPHSGTRALAAIRASEGSALAVTDAAILDSLLLLAHHAGMLVEPAAAATLAGAIEARQRGIIAASERVLLVLTGSGLKSMAAIEPQLRAASHATCRDAAPPPSRRRYR
jgi:threonine synthase